MGVLNEKGITEEIQTKQLKWYGYIQPINNERLPNEALICVPLERRKKGKPKRSRLEGILNTMESRHLQEGQWNNREEWALGIGRRPILYSLMLAGNEFQSLGRSIVKEDEYEEVRWDGIVSIVSWRERVFRLWWEERDCVKHVAMQRCHIAQFHDGLKRSGKALLHRYQRECDDFLGRIVAMDETWTRSYEPNLKRQSNEWKHPGSPRPKKVRPTQSAVKEMFIVAYDINGVILNHAVPPRQTENADYWNIHRTHPI
ncbi:hypothetical protein ANN_20052 [Periplaneta americana]|uniref:Transposase n=1 Tax=Periplaneta americana TaxID=6978 RepID=A0ABQ8SBL1_PERAM|nr:hypothetical protein ANN_20052 [Periplaneta americana]